MKKVFFLVVVIAIGMFYACERETVEAPTEVESIEATDLVEIEGKRYGRCFYLIEPGLKFLGRCYTSFPSICKIHKICIPDIIYDPCWFVPCWIDIFDPWIIYEKLDPREFISIKDKLELDIDPKEAAIPFALNERIAGLQVYNQEGILKGETFVIKENLVLDAEVSKELGLQGNVVRAGEYPVIANKENGTFNVILSVEKGFER
ncbi:hypothetical protein [Aquimarina litoralis]|uniref:hypothetical protein n=1 Tax=Aquimarina litoralis TaxID=584605 RepID=UPI001C561360|nr:hypothetical protein [Aquimarina litoralis]MBW1294062.1 hypothetical protein [Aquimarina litoralis]